MLHPTTVGPNASKAHAFEGIVPEARFPLKRIRRPLGLDTPADQLSHAVYASRWIRCGKRPSFRGVTEVSKDVDRAVKPGSPGCPLGWGLCGCIGSRVLRGWRRIQTAGAGAEGRDVRWRDDLRGTVLLRLRSVHLAWSGSQKAADRSRRPLPRDATCCTALRTKTISG